VDYTTGLNPRSVTTEISTEIIKLDLAVANYTSNTVSNLDANGDGTFLSKADYPTGQSYSVTRRFSTEIINPILPQLITPAIL